MRVLFVTQWFEPEPIFKGLRLVQALAAKGHQVEVLTGFPNYPSGKVYAGYKIVPYQREVIDGVIVHRVALYPSHDDSTVRRMLNYLSFAFAACVFLCRHGRRFDVIYAYPQVIVGMAAALAGWITRRPFLLDIQDMWPDTVLKSGMSGAGLMGPPLKALCSFVYRRAAHIAAQSEGMKAELVKRGVPADKISVVFNWADEDSARSNGACDLQPYNFENRFNFVFGGNFGRMQGLDTLVRAAHIAGQKVPHIHLLLIGDGMDRARLEALRSELQARNVTIAPPVSREAIGNVFGAADVLVLHLLKDPLFEITIPSKTQFYLAMGKPILVGVSGEAGQIVRDARAGLSVPPQDEEALASAMIKMSGLRKSELDEMGRCGREAYWQRFSFATAIDRTEEALRSCLAASSK